MSGDGHSHTQLIEIVIRVVVEAHESLALDSEDDREALIRALVKALETVAKREHQ